MASLADLQTEREALRAATAKAEFESALADTLKHEDVLAAGLAARRVIHDALDALVDELLTAIEHEHDETRVHYRMTDTVTDWLHQLGQRAQAVSGACPVFGARLRAGLAPRGLLTVSQWADRYRHLATGTNAPGPWRTDLTPYMREIMDSLSEHSPARSVTFIKSAGVGGTEGLYNWLGYIMHHLANKDVLVVVPTLELRDRSFNPRFVKMLSESPALAELISTASRNKANRAELMEYGARARILKAGANSADSLRSDHLPYVICDEVDAFPWDVGGEGDPMTLIENRQRTFSRAKTYYVSTPTKEGASRIHLLYTRSDRRRYNVPCPHCGETQPLEFKNLKWDASRIQGQEDLPESERLKTVTAAWYECAHCHAAIDEGHKSDMLTRGRWIAERPGVKAARGYHLNALYAPVGLGLNWRAVAQKWLDCQGDTAELKGFVNTYLGEVWKEIGDSIEDIALIARLEDYPDKLPAALTTAGVDVQKDRLEASVVKWGAGEEAWLIDHLILPGDTARPEVWDDLDEALKDAGVQYAAIDSGYNTSMVYAFVEKRRWTVAIKGVTGKGRPLIEDERKRRQRLRYARKKAVRVEPIGVDQGKALIYSRLKLTQTGAGYIHFPRDPAFDDEYFAQLAAEKLITKIKGTRPFSEWVQTRPRNEALDCLVYATAAMRLAGRPLDKTDPSSAGKGQGEGKTAPTPTPTRPITPPTGDWNFERRT